MIDYLGMLSGSLPAPAKAASDPEEGPEKLFAMVLAQQLRSAMPEEALGGEWGDVFGPLLDELLAAEIEQKLKATIGSVSRPAPGPVRPMRAYGAGHGQGQVGEVTSAYGSRIHPVTGERAVHHGVDLGAPRGTPIQVGRAGVVVRAERAGGYGNLVEVDHGDGVTTRYAHCDRLDVRPGDTVEAGEQLGTVGSTGRTTGPHLHFEVRIEGEAVNPQESRWNDLFPQLSMGGGR